MKKPKWKGVDLAPSKINLLKQVNVVAETFRLARAWAPAHLERWLNGEDPFREITDVAESLNIKFILVLFNGMYDGEGIKKLKELNKIDNWLDYWLQRDFLKHYFCVDIINEPHTKDNNAWQADFTLNIIPEIKRRTPLPLTIGFIMPSTTEEFVLQVEPKLDYMSCHYYNGHHLELPEEKILAQFDRLIDFFKSFNKPTILSEWGSNDLSEDIQYQYIKLIRDEAEKKKLNGYFVHSLWDIAWIPNTELGGWGIYNPDWTPRKALTLFQ